MDETENEQLLLSEYILDFMIFGDVFKPSRGWIDSDIRAWLNGPFYEAAFSEAEKERILPVEIRPSESKYYFQDLRAVSTDRLFLLDAKEIQTFLSLPTLRKAPLTPYAQTKLENADDPYWWWTRSCDSAEYDGATVHYVNQAFVVWDDWDGSQLEEWDNLLETEENGGVRPAMWIHKKTKQEAILSKDEDQNSFLNKLSKQGGTTR